jgi:hypothetical protein
MPIDRLLRANRTIMLVPVIDGATEPLLVGTAGTTCPISAPTSAVLDTWRSVITTSATGAGSGGNISCALLDDVTLGLAASDTDTELTVCSIGNEETPTFYNVDAELVALRDKNQADTGVFNLATQLLNAPDVRYAAVDRLGYASTAAFASGQIVSIYEVFTDNPVDVKEDRGNLKIQQNPLPTGVVNTLYTLLS